MILFTLLLFSCWLNLSNPVSATFLVPMSLLFVVTVIMLLVSIFASSEITILSAANQVRSRY